MTPGKDSGALSLKCLNSSILATSRGEFYGDTVSNFVKLLTFLDVTERAQRFSDWMGWYKMWCIYRLCDGF